MNVHQKNFTRAPLYQQVRDALMERIQSGEWRVGIAIPNEPALARENGVSEGTMRKALDLLEFQRILTRRQGRGTFVREQLDWDSLPNNATAFLDAVGGGSMAGRLLKADSGRNYHANDLREIADGALEIAAALERRMPAKGSKAAA